MATIINAARAVNKRRLRQLYKSSAIGVSGINAPADITVLNGEYSINGAAYTSAAGTVSNGDQVRVRHNLGGDSGNDDRYDA